MLAADDQPTIPAVHVPRLLVVGGEGALYETVCAAAVHLQLLVSHASVREAATEAARLRPLVLVLAEPIYDFDRAWFDELARDVGARLLVSGDQPDVRRIAEELIFELAALEATA
jgi:hypothetical protein